MTLLGTNISPTKDMLVPRTVARILPRSVPVQKGRRAVTNPTAGTAASSPLQILNPSCEGVLPLDEEFPAKKTTVWGN